jgi:phosphate transport system permease protein
VRGIVEAMTALPSIVAGLFIYTVLIVGLHFPRSGFTAAMAISVMMLPIIARAGDVALRVVPGGLREAGLALGASHWQTVWRVVLPTARPGLATAVILGVGAQRRRDVAGPADLGRLHLLQRTRSRTR